jgi:hypothetical protein
MSVTFKAPTLPYRQRGEPLTDSLDNENAAIRVAMRRLAWDTP